MRTILARWRSLGWITPYPTLDRHLEHICGGMAVVLVFLGLGVEWWYAAVISTTIFGTVELITALFRQNWRDSTMDFVQYQFHWPLYFAGVGNWWLFAATLVGVLWLYFTLLRRGW